MTGARMTPKVTVAARPNHDAAQYDLRSRLARAARDPLRRPVAEEVALAAAHALRTLAACIPAATSKGRPVDVARLDAQIAAQRASRGLPPETPDAAPSPSAAPHQGD